ncbi:MAG: DUF4271 domain-containing protein [Paludibacter sp.]|nr:DUF4271 domain-containing protein [Paludibacter sp.]
MFENQTINQVPADSINDSFTAIINATVQTPDYKIDSTQIKSNVKLQAEHGTNNLQQISQYQWDTLQVSIVQSKMETGFEGILPNNSIYTSPWIFIGFLLMMFFPIVVFYRSKSFLKDSFSLIFKKQQPYLTSRSFYTLDPVVLVLMNIFFVISLGFYIYHLYPFAKNDFSCIKLGWIFGITASFFLIKILLNSFLAYVFFDKAGVRVTILNYLNILSVSGLFIFPLLILRIYAITQLNFYIDITTATILIISILIIVFKIFRLFFSKLIDIFYILLYLCTLEILPLFVLFRAYQIIV